MEGVGHHLLVVAHPDDETLFFSGPLLHMKDRPWKVICVTDGNADGKGLQRRREFTQACLSMGASESFLLDFPDLFHQRLPLPRLQEQLLRWQGAETVFSHGPIGEYGHPHHQDVCRAVHEVFQHTKIFSPAYNCFPELRIHLDTDAYQKKAAVLRDTYFSETQRFIQFYPVMADEGFTAFTYREVTAIYDFIARNQDLREDCLVAYKWYAPYLASVREHSSTRPF